MPVRCYGYGLTFIQDTGWLNRWKYVILVFFADGGILMLLTLTDKKTRIQHILGNKLTLIGHRVIRIVRNKHTTTIWIFIQYFICYTYFYPYQRKVYNKKELNKLT